jgi:hypothetical protein
MIIPSQLRPADHQILQHMHGLASSLGVYNYLEIGSYLGGSLQYALLSPRCTKVVSVDTRLTGPNLLRSQELWNCTPIDRVRIVHMSGSRDAEKIIKFMKELASDLKLEYDVPSITEFVTEPEIFSSSGEF